MVKFSRIEIQKPEPYMTLADLARHLRVDEKKLIKWQEECVLPQPDLILGPHESDRRWRRESIEGAIKKHFASLRPAAPHMMMAPEDVANYLRIDYQTVNNLVRSGRLPPADNVIGNRPRWFFDTIKNLAEGGKI